MRKAASKSPRAYSYVRFSTPDQQKGDSLRRQTEAAARWASARGIELDNSSYQDLGVSAYAGDNAEVGMLGEFLGAVRDGTIEAGSYLLIESLDRLSRDKARRAVRLLEDLCDSGIAVVTLADGKEYTKDALDNDPMGLMWALMVAMRANEESATKSRRVREAWAKKKEAAATELRPMTKRLPAWLVLSPDRATISVHEERASVVRRIFRDTIAGKGQHSIAQTLTVEGVETFGDGRRKAAIWHRSYVKKLLESPTVIGTLVPHDTRKVKGKRVRDPLAPIPNYYPAIVAAAVFARVNGARKGSATPRIRAASGQVSNVLASLAKCPRCAATMTRVNKGRKGGTPYLVCVTAKAAGPCTYKQVRLESIEQAIRGASGTFIRDVPGREAHLDEQRHAVETREHGIGESIDRLVEEIERGNSSPALRRRLTVNEALLESARAELEQIEARIRESGGRAIERRLARLVAVLDNPQASITDVNVALREAFRGCTVNYGEGTLEFAWLHSNALTEVRYGMPEQTG
ncbi:serine recombinase [Mesorhizobium sp. LSJC255A00]|uniref:recombinase family protein n=1 Tax=Mesorhizobium sp. LSJC255A00 TaxID=1287313 RepID=UPI0003CF4362|nr:recombinase family protein [Mesorhizobium sp. LSJC255A00]ESX22127.1 serine recombinase [Mesorhizobium sp. LSJC255A00]